MTRRPLAIGVALLAVGAAGSVAEANLRATYKWTDPSLESSPWSLPDAATVSNIIYLNNCAGGCQLSPGQNNATTNRSSIINSAVNIPAYTGTATQ